MASRSIPACAGEPVRMIALTHERRVYPRVCGGTSGISTHPESVKGLSPRVRGNRAITGQRISCQRSIPACAGEPVANDGVRHSAAVYPRVCGGTGTTVTSNVIQTGLSPRVRGNHERQDRERHDLRSIPACAGEPRRNGVFVSRSKVYPRVCGGTVRGRPNTASTSGLSPRVRGNLKETVKRSTSVRSIPACAGEPQA